MAHSQKTQFLRQCVKQKQHLTNWIINSVAQMDALVAKGFPVLFGDGWQEKMKAMTTPEKTKLLTYIFDHSLELVAREQQLIYTKASVDITSETHGFDALLFNCEIENKLTLSKDKASFGTGNRNTIESKGNRILSVKLIHNGVETIKLFVTVIDLTHKSHSKTGWASSATVGRPRDSFATLKIHVDDYEIIVPICGGLKQGKDYIHATYR